MPAVVVVGIHVHVVVPEVPVTIVVAAVAIAAEVGVVAVVVAKRLCHHERALEGRPGLHLSRSKRRRRRLAWACW